MFFSKEVATMVFKPGDVVCLWGVKHEGGQIIIHKEILVTVMEVKTGVEGLPKTYQSLRGMTEDGRYFEKHWRYWPGVEIKLHERHHWSESSDGDSGKWVPQEAVNVYNLAPKNRVKIVDLLGREIKPKSAAYCKEHDRYSFAGEKCLYCPIDTKPKTKPE